MSDKHYRWLALAVLALCCCVVVLGAYVRLSDAGLGCPDWPGCYGQLVVPQDHAAASAAYPQRPLEAHKAWKEMIHRYLASVLGLGIVALAVAGWRRGPARGLLGGMVALVIFQGILGMWTVTWQLKPLAVSAHLLGGMSTLGLLAWLNARLWRPARRSGPAPRALATAALLALAVQIFLGGWTSSNYAALACPDLPTCHGVWWPKTDFGEAFVLWRGLGTNYEFGVLDSPARTAIHLSHRIGAVLIGGFLLLVAVLLYRRPPWRGWGLLLGAGVSLQITLGVATVAFGLPLAVAAAHNAGAALLVLILVGLNEATWRRIPS